MTTVSTSLRLALAAGLALLTAAAPARAAVSPVFDVNVGDMRSADWVQTALVDTGAPSTVAFDVVNRAGSSDSFWRTSYSKPAGPGPNSSTDVVANIFQLQGWDPATQGAIDGLQVLMDARGLSSTFSGSLVTGFVRPAIEQGGIVYTVLASDLRVDVADDFSTLSWTLDDAANWRSADGSSRTPDFSVAGAPLHFGYRFGLIANCTGARCSSSDSVLGIDNFRVDVLAAALPPGASVPEPATLALAVMALLGCTRTARRPRR